MIGGFSFGLPIKILNSKPCATAILSSEHFIDTEDSVQGLQRVKDECLESEEDEVQLSPGTETMRPLDILSYDVKSELEVDFETVGKEEFHSCLQWSSNQVYCDRLYIYGE